MRNIMLNTIFTTTLLASSLCFADLLQVKAGSDKVEGVPQVSSATTPEGTTLQFVGAGLRSKKVMMIGVKVYVGQLLVSNLSAFNRAEALQTATDAAPIAIQMHFLRDVDAAKVQSSFVEALEANKVDLKKSEVQKFLVAVKTGGEAKEGKNLTILGVKNKDGSESVTYEDAAAKATTISGGAGFIRDIFSIWLGQPSDDGVAKLKASILK